MLSQSLEMTLTRVLNSQKSEQYTACIVEVVLLEILRNSTVAELLDSQNIAVKAISQQLTDHINGNQPIAHSSPEDVISPLLQRAVFNVQQAGQKTVGETDIIYAILEQDSTYAAQILQNNGLSSQDSAAPSTSDMQPHLTDTPFADAEINDCRSRAQYQLNKLVAEYWKQLPEQERHTAKIEDDFKIMLESAIRFTRGN